MRPLIALFVAAMAMSPRTVLLTVLLWCCAAAHAVWASAAGLGSELKRGRMPVTEALQGGVGQAAGVLSPVQSSELPMLPGAGKFSNNNRVLHTRLAGLPQRSAPALQFGQGLLWLNHTDQGAQGVGVSVLPLSLAPQRLTIDGVYIDQDAGSMAARHNRAWSLAVNSRWLGKRLTLHGEYARSQKNLDPWDSLLEPHSGEAYALFASYADQSHIRGSRPLIWGLTVNWQQASRAFWSPAAGGVARGKAIAQAAANMHWGQLDARLSFARATTNVADDPGVPTLSVKTLTADLHYTAQQPIASSGFGRLFAAPSYALYLKHEHSSLEQAPASGSANIPDRFRDTATLRARFTPGPWWWQVSYTHSMLRVPGQEAAGIDSNRARLHLYLPLNLHLPLSDWLELTPALQWSRTEGQGTANDTRTITGILSGAASLIPHRLAAKLHIRAHRRYSSREEAVNRTVAAESSLSWAFQPSQTHRPSVTISLRGSYRYADNSVNSSSAQFQAFCGIEVSWPNTD